MKKIFIPAKSNQEISSSAINKALKNLPEKISICYSIQFSTHAEEIKKILEKKHKILSFQQVLGCSNPKFPEQTQAVLLVSSGKFHAISLAFESKLPVFLIDNCGFEKISEKEISAKEKTEKSAYLNYLNSEEAGIIITAKPGQQRLQKATEFKESSKKKHYLFLCNNINPLEFENFGMNSFVNTGCPRMDFDDIRIININKIKNE
jgi:diphthamide biosynthesis enzyme Dph1/Dph2-like protein